MLAAPLFFSIFLQVKTCWLKHSAIQRFRHQQAVCLYLSYASAGHLEQGDEIEVSGQLYDVEKAVHQPTQVIVYAWPDTEENEILAALHSLQAQEEDDEQKEITYQLLDYLLLPFEHPAVIQLTSFINDIFKQYPASTVSLSTVHLPVSTPPPLS